MTANTVLVSRRAETKAIGASVMQINWLLRSALQPYPGFLRWPTQTSPSVCLVARPAATATAPELALPWALAGANQPEPHVQQPAGNA
jgi:hypothetical protein